MAIFFFLTTCLDFWFSSCGSANAHLPGCFSPWTFPLIVRLDSIMSYLDSLLGYSTGEFQALQIIVLAAFGAMD